MSTFVSITGTITKPIQRDDTGLCRFSVENEAGRFYVQVRWSSQLEWLRMAHEIQAVGTLHSFVFSRCRCHHIYISRP